jgi:hypothetical protein
VDEEQQPDCVTWSLVNELVRVSISVVLNLVFELNFSNVFTGRDDTIEVDIWFIHVYVVCFVILIMLNILLG